MISHKQFNSLIRVTSVVLSACVRLNAATLSVGTGEPYQTISAAVAAADAGDLILIHKGVYRENIKLRKDHLTLQPFGSDCVLITGLDPVQGDWSRVQNNIWQTTLSTPVTDVFAGAAEMDKARYPNANGNRLSLKDRAITSTSEANADGQATVTFEGMDKPKDFWVGGYYSGNNGPDPWTADCGQIIASKGNSIRVAIDTPQWRENCRLLIGKGNGYIINCLNALDGGKEWHWQADKLYFCPPQAVNPGTLGIEVRTRLYVIDADHVTGVTLKGLHFKAGGIRLTECQSCLIDGCTILYPGPWADYNYKHDFGGLQDGTYGVYLSGRNNTIKNCYIAGAWGAALTLDGSGTLCENCLVEQANWLGRRDGGIHCIGDHCRVTCCSVRNTGRDGIDGGNGKLGYGRFATNLKVDHCDIRDVGFISADCGFFYINTQGSELPANVDFSYNSLLK